MCRAQQRKLVHNLVHKFSNLCTKFKIGAQRLPQQFGAQNSEILVKFKLSKLLNIVETKNVSIFSKYLSIFITH
jgi:hypothetical protein